MRDDWKIVRIKDFAKNIGSGSTPSSENERFYDNGTIPWINTGDLNANFITENKKNITDLAYASYPILRYFYPETVIIALYGATIGKLGILTYKATVNQACCCITLFNNYYYKYLFYYLSYSKDEILKNSFGGTQPNISQKTVANILVYLPPLPVQHAIANYLDKKLGVIDKHISLLENKRDTYKRLRKNLINHVVRQGLVEPVETKDSGIEWLGKIPKHWEVKRVKDLFNISRGRVIPQTELDESGYPVYSSQTEDDGCLGFIKTYDYNTEALTWTTDGVNAGSVFYRTGKFNCTNICGVLSPKSRFILKFIYYFLSVNTIHYKRLDTNGAKIMSNEMAPIILVLPPLSEQQTIADYLDKQTQKIDNILENISEQLGKLAQLKKSLINETVTGNRNITTGDTNIA